MSDFGFELDGLDELKADIERCVNEYPEETSQKIITCLAGLRRM